MSITLELQNFDPPIIPEDWFSESKRLPGTVAAYGPNATMGPPATLPDVIGSNDMTMFNRVEGDLNQPAPIGAVTFPYGRTYNGVNQYESVNTAVITPGNNAGFEVVFRVPETLSSNVYVCALGSSSASFDFFTLRVEQGTFNIQASHRHASGDLLEHTVNILTGATPGAVYHFACQKVDASGWKFAANGAVGTATQTTATSGVSNFDRSAIGAIVRDSATGFYSDLIASVAYLQHDDVYTDTQLRNRWEQVHHLWRADPGQDARTVTAPSLNTYASRKSLPSGVARVGYQRSLPAGDFTIEIPYLHTALPGDYDTLVSQGSLDVQLNSDGTITVIDGADPINGAIPLQLGQWNVIHLTRSGTTAKLYVNGALDQTGAIETVPNDILKVGDPTNQPAGNNGRVKVWDTALTVEEITIATNEVNAAVGRLQKTTGSGFGLGLGFD